jgi:hypothetical protein
MTGRVLRVLAVSGLTLAVLTAAPLAAHATAGTSAATTRSGHAQVVPASGDFTVTLDLTSIAARPVGTRCLLTVSGTLVFSGTLEGTAAATTAALEDAACADVATHPPGTFADVFRSTGTFSGTVDGRPVEARLVYAGRTAVGGSIDALMLFTGGVTGGVTGALRVEAEVAVGGTYRGLLVEH